MHQTTPTPRWLAIVVAALARPWLWSAAYLVFGPPMALLAKLTGRRLIDLAEQAGRPAWRTRRRQATTLRAMRSLS